MELVGKQYIDFVDKEGKRIQGVKLHLVVSDPKVEGRAAIAQFINYNSDLYSKAVNIPLGKIVIEYGYRGSIVDIYTS